MSQIVKVVFPLGIDEEGFPPISSESLNARAEERGFMLENTPFFVTGVALGDRVHATPIHDQPNCFAFDTVVISSGNKALSIIFLEIDIKNTVYQELKQRGCYCEYGEFGKGGALQMLAVSVPVECDYHIIAQYLTKLEDEDMLSYAELAV